MALKDISSGWRATGVLLRLRARLTQSVVVKMFLAVAILVLAIGELTAINLGSAAKLAAQQNDGTVGILARIWINSITHGYAANTATFALGGAILAITLVPFTGTAILSLNPIEDLTALRPAQLHRYFDALILNAISSLGLMQIFTLTGIASLLSMDGNRVPALVFVATVWVFIIVSMTTVGWGLEWLSRRYGPNAKLKLAIGLLSVAGAAVALDPQHGSTLFGLSKNLTGALQSGVYAWTPESILLPVGTFLTATLIGLAGLAATQRALNHPALPTKANRSRKYHPIGRNPEVAIRRLIVRTLWRTREVRRPVISILIVGTLTLTFVPMTNNVVFSMLAAIPITVALAFGLNIFGVLGTGTVWIASLPTGIRRVPRISFTLQYVLTIGLLIYFWAVSYLTGHSSLKLGSHLIVGGLLSAVTIASFSVLISIVSPRRAPLSGRGDSLLAPLSSLGYLVALVLIGPLPAVLFLISSSLPQRLLIIVLSLTMSLLFLFVARTKWDNKTHRANVVAQTSVA